MSNPVTGSQDTIFQQNRIDSHRNRGDLNGRSTVLILPSKHNIKHFWAGACPMSTDCDRFFCCAATAVGLVLTAVTALAVGVATSFDPTKTAGSAAAIATISFIASILIKRRCG